MTRRIARPRGPARRIFLSYAVRKPSVKGMLAQFTARASACAAVLLLAGASGCSAAGGPADDTLFVEGAIGTCEHVLNAGDLAHPVLPEATAELNVRTYAEPLRRTVIVSSALPVENQEAVIAAIDTLRAMTSGNVDLQPVIAETTCDQAWAYHGAEQRECHMMAGGGGWRVGWTQSPKHWKLTLRTTTAEGGVPTPLETYTVALHESLHALGLGHGSGIMSPDLPDMIDCPEISASQAAKIAEKHTWNPAEILPGAYLYML